MAHWRATATESCWPFCFLFFQDECLPDFYLEELRRHLVLYPNAHNVSCLMNVALNMLNAARIVSCHAGTRCRTWVCIYAPICAFFSFYSWRPVGYVHCLEDGCGQVIHLINRIREADGGIKDGMGSLSAYRVSDFDFCLYYTNQWLLSQHHLTSHTTNMLIKPESSPSSRTVRTLCLYSWRRPFKLLLASTMLLKGNPFRLLSPPLYSLLLFLPSVPPLASN